MTTLTDSSSGGIAPANALDGANAMTKAAAEAVRSVAK
jgi:hypothetical protein